MKLLVQVMDGRMRVYFNKTGETLTPSDREELARLRVRFTNLFGEEARPMATAFFNKNITYTKSSFRAATKPIVEATEEDLRERKRKAMAKQTRFQIKLDAKTDKLELSQFEDAIEDNVNLIKTIPSKYFDKIGKAVELRTVGKMSRGALVKRIKELGGVTQRRAELIADDQTAKVTERMMLARCRNAGIKRVMWLHSSISMHPRDYHKTRWDGHTGKYNGKPNGLNGYIFPIDKPPVIDRKTGERGYPAQLINCHCFLTPVLLVD
jgi:uncharacterized protein with gpF-like domain